MSSISEGIEVLRKEAPNAYEYRLTLSPPFKVKLLDEKRDSTMKQLDAFLKERWAAVPPTSELQGVSKWIPSGAPAVSAFYGASNWPTDEEQIIKDTAKRTKAKKVEPNSVACSRCQEPFPYEPHESGKCYSCRQVG